MDGEIDFFKKRTFLEFSNPPHVTFQSILSKSYYPLFSCLSPYIVFYVLFLSVVFMSIRIIHVVCYISLFIELIFQCINVLQYIQLLLDIQFISVSHLCLTLCDPMDCSMDIIFIIGHYSYLNFLGGGELS